MAQVDLGTRVHRNRTLDDLGPQSLVVLQTALDRAGVRSANPATLVRPGHPPLVKGFGELPPIASLPELSVGRTPPRPPAAGLPDGPSGRRSRLRPGRPRDERSPDQPRSVDPDPLAL